MRILQHFTVPLLFALLLRKTVAQCYGGASLGYVIGQGALNIGPCSLDAHDGFTACCDHDMACTPEGLCNEGGGGSSTRTGGGYWASSCTDPTGKSVACLEKTCSSVDKDPQTGEVYTGSMVKCGDGRFYCGHDSVANATKCSKNSFSLQAILNYAPGSQSTTSAFDAAAGNIPSSTSTAAAVSGIIAPDNSTATFPSTSSSTSTNPSSTANSTPFELTDHAKDGIIAGTVLFCLVALLIGVCIRMMRRRGYLHRRKRRVSTEVESGTVTQPRDGAIAELPGDEQGPVAGKRYELDGESRPAELVDETPQIAELDASGYARSYR